MANEQIPVNVVGSSVFGRYPKVNSEKTFNMFVSDDWLVNTPGYKKRLNIVSTTSQAKGRGLFHSVKGDFLIAVVNAGVYRISRNLSPIFLGNIGTTSGEVSIAENLNKQICIVDGQKAYIYNWLTLAFGEAVPATAFPFTPSYVDYQNTYFLFTSQPYDTNPSKWYAYQSGFLLDPVTAADALKLTAVTNGDKAISTKSDNTVAIKRIPGRGNNVLVFGSSVAEVWTDVGGADVYRRVQSFNVDSGCVSRDTIAANDQYVVWVGKNEHNAPAIMVSDGSSFESFSTDGISHLMQTVTRPQDSTAFFFRQDGHLFYAVTFYADDDNFTIFFDFNTKKFYNLSDEYMNFFPCRQIAFFKEKTYFVSLRDQGLYELSTDILNYSYEIDEDDLGQQIPRVRVCKTIRKKDSSPFRINNFQFWIEQGYDTEFLVNNESGLYCQGLMITEPGVDFIVSEDDEPLLAEDGICVENNLRPRVDMSYSKNGAAYFGTTNGVYLNSNGHYHNRISWHRMSRANEFTVQLRFWGFQRFAVNDGVVEVT